MSNAELATLFLLQLAVIICACLVVGVLARYIRQPLVIGEMLVGIALGPSLLGWCAPRLQALLFPPSAMNSLSVISQLGLVLYMFLVGVEVDLGSMNRQLRFASWISSLGILVPLVVGCSMVPLLLGNQSFGLFSSGNVSFQGTFFFGVAMSITAFPVLARIISERGLMRTDIGTLALTAGALNDVVAWCLLAIILATLTVDPVHAVLTIGGCLFYILVVFFPGRFCLRWLERRATQNGITLWMLATLLALVLLSSWTTERLGLHQIFGAFILGVALPRGALTRYLHATLMPLIMSLLLPLYFVYSGLHTQIGLLQRPELWGVTLLICLLATVCKGGTCWLVATVHGEKQPAALTIGSLMNTRGLMELIILNIGLEYHVITPTLFTIMVLMAIITTMMAGPIIDLCLPRLAKPVLVTQIGSQQEEKTEEGAVKEVS